MARIVILEGPDCGGKTTLANELVKCRNFDYVHVGPPQPNSNVLADYASILYYARLNEKDVVVDRLHLGEKVYGPLLRGRDQLGEEGLALIQRQIVAYGAHVVLCLPPYETCIVDWRKRHGQELVNKEDVYARIYARYQALSKQDQHARMVKYDYTTIRLEIAIGAICSRLCEYAIAPFEVIGSPRPIFLVVGEVANQKLDVPFMALDNSSTYLYHCIKEAGYIERELAFVNAYKVTGKLNSLHAIWDELGKPVCLALGNRARSAIHSMLIPEERIVDLPHPAFWKRFKSDRRNEYVEKLRNARVRTYNNIRP